MSIKIDDIVAGDMVGSKVIHSTTHIGLFNYTGFARHIFRAIVLSKHPLSATRLLRIVTRKLRFDLYKYCGKVSFYKSTLIYGVRVLFVKIVWARY